MDDGLRNVGELSLASVTVMSMDTTPVSLRGVVLESSATLNACNNSQLCNSVIELMQAIGILTLTLME